MEVTELKHGAPEGYFGNVSFVPTDKHRAAVELMARHGLTNPQIGPLLDPPISESTLKKYFGTELRLGRYEGPKFAAGQLYKKIEEGNLTAIIFYLKAKGGFNERAAFGDVPEDDFGGNNYYFNFNLRGASDDELSTLRKFLSGRAETDSAKAEGLLAAPDRERGIETPEGVD